MKYLVSANDMACFGSCDGNQGVLTTTFCSKQIYFIFWLYLFKGQKISQIGLKAYQSILRNFIRHKFLCLKIHSKFNGKHNVCRQPQTTSRLPIPRVSPGDVIIYRGKITCVVSPINNQIGFNNFKLLNLDKGYEIVASSQPWNGLVWIWEWALSGPRYPGLGYCHWTSAQQLQN